MYDGTFVTYTIRQTFVVYFQFREEGGEEWFVFII